jgi:chromosome segregation ATPase
MLIKNEEIKELAKTFENESKRLK